MKNSYNLNRLWIALSTLFLVGLAFAYYFLIYVPDKEAVITQKKYRALKRIGQNFIAMKKDYHRSIKQEIWDHEVNLQGCYDLITEADQKLMDSKWQEILELTKGYYQKKRTEKDNRKLDQQIMMLRKEMEDLQSPSINCENALLKNLHSAIAQLKLSNPAPYSYPEKFTHRISAPEKLYFFSGEESYDFNYTTLKLSDFIANQSLADNHFDRFLVIRLFKPSPKKPNDPYNNFFDESLDTRETSSQTLKKDSVLSFLAYQGKKYNASLGSENKILLGKLDSIFNNSQGLNSIPVRTVKISGVPFRMFSHIIEMEEDEDWVLAGLVNENDIRSESRGVQLIVVIFFILCFLFLLLAMPVLKLAIMSPIERLQVSNVWFLGISIVIGTSVAFLILLVSHHYFNYEENLKREVKDLSAEIDKRFTQEVSDIIEQLRGEQTAAFAKTKISNGTFHLAEKILSKKDTLKPVYPFYNETILLNRKGDAVITLATHPLPARSVIPNISGRYYFKDARDNKLHPLADTTNPEPFAIQSILSWNSMAHEAGIGIRPDAAILVRDKSDKIIDTVQVLAIATKLRSVMDPLLPPGFDFCIINQTGEVLFHSQKDKNLQENFFDETERNKRIKAAIEGRVTVLLPVEYGGKKSLAYIKPIVNQPMYLVTLYDKDYYHVPIVFTLSFTVILVALLFILQGIQMTILFVATYRPTKLRNKRFFMFWIRPRVSEIVQGDQAPQKPVSKSWLDFFRLDVPFRQRYIRCIVVILAIAVFLTGISLLDINLIRVMCVVLATVPVMLFAVYFLVLNDEKRDAGQSMKKSFLAGSAALLLLIDMLAIQFLEFSILIVIAVQLATAAIIYVALWTPLLNWLHKPFNSFPTSRLYVIFICSWLFMVSILPTAFFYKAAFKHESLIWKRFLQWETFQAMEKRNANLIKEFKAMAAIDEKQSEKFDSLQALYMEKSNEYGSYAGIKKIAAIDSTARALNYSALDEMEFDLRPEYKGPMENSRKVLLTSIHDKPWKWFLTSDDTLVLKHHKDGAVISALVSDFTFIKGHYILIFGIGFLIICALVYKTVSSATKYIFGIGLLSPGKSLDAMADTIVKRITEPETKYRTFIIGLPFSGKTNLTNGIREKLDEMKSTEQNYHYIEHLLESRKEIDLRTDLENPPQISNSHRLFILKHFEFAINEHKMNEKRFNLLQTLQLKDNIKLMISSSVEPSLILEVYERKIERLMEEKKSPNADPNIRNELVELRSSYRKWKNMLAGFEVVHLPLKFRGGSDFIDRELEIGTYLPKLKHHFSTEQISKEDFILDVEEIADPYYHALWNAFSRNEKRVLFDLAKDQFVNLRDISKVRLLIKKGIIIMEDHPRVMNQSFNNFILAAVKEDEEMEMNTELKRKGTWHAVQLILVITLASIIIFVALVQHEMLSNLNATIGTVSAVVALLVRFSGFFVSSKVKEA